MRAAAANDHRKQRGFDVGPRATGVIMLCEFVCGRGREIAKRARVEEN